MSQTSITVLSLRVVSLSNRSLMMLRAGSTGTEVVPCPIFGTEYYLILKVSPLITIIITITIKLVPPFSSSCVITLNSSLNSTSCAITFNTLLFPLTIPN